MEVVVAVIVFLIGILLGYLIANHRLHKQTGGTLVFDRAEPKNAPYLCFESYDELDEIRTKKYATLAVEWTNSNTRT